MRKDIKVKIARRLKIAEGQMRGIQKMVEDEKYCIDIITQANAIREALAGVERLLLENHLTTHIVMQMKNGETEKATREMLKIYKQAQK